MRDARAAEGEPQVEPPVEDGFPRTEARINTARARVVARDAELLAKALSKPVCEREWRFLDASQRQCVERLGFDAHGWDRDQDPDWQRTPKWGEMTGAQRADAEALAFDEDSWWGPPPYD